MADSSIDEDLFADNNVPGMGEGGLNEFGIGVEGDESLRNQSHYDAPPMYVHESDFSEFAKEHQVQLNQRYGYLCIFLYRPYYFPGQTVRGFAILDAFNDIPNRDIHIRIKGREVPGKHGNRIAKKLVKAPELFHLESFQQSQLSGAGVSGINKWGNSSALGGGAQNLTQKTSAPANEQGNGGILRNPYQPQGSQSQVPVNANSSPISLLETRSNVRTSLIDQQVPQSYQNLPRNAATISNVNDVTSGSALGNHGAAEIAVFTEGTSHPQVLQTVITQDRLAVNQKYQDSHNELPAQQLLTIPPNPATISNGSQLGPEASNNSVHPQKKLDLINSALVLSKRKVPKQDEEPTRSIPLFDQNMIAFQFRDKEIKKGQYRVPFSFKLPLGLPGSFKYTQVNSKKATIVDKIMIEYTIEVYIDLPGHPSLQVQNRLHHKKEIDIKEYLFTDVEIESDWKNYQKILNLKKVLRPNTIFAGVKHINELNFEDGGKVLPKPSEIQVDDEVMPQLPPLEQLPSKYPIIEETKSELFGKEELANAIAAQAYQQALSKQKLNALLHQRQSQGLTNNQWHIDQMISSKRCLCFKSNYTLRIQAQLNKQLFYPEEEVVLDFFVDSTRSERDIKEIRAKLKYTVTVRKADETLQTIDLDMAMVEKGRNVKVRDKDLRREQFVFNLGQILSEYHFRPPQKIVTQKSEIIMASSKHKQITAQQSLWDSGNTHKITEGAFIGGQGIRVSEPDQPHYLGGHRSMTMAGPISTHSQRKFEKQRSKFIEESGGEHTFLTVKGITVSSEFSIDVALIVADRLGETTHEQSFPLTIRSRKYGEFINDLDSIGAQPVVAAAQEVLEKYSAFFSDPFSLPGCNFEVELAV